MEMDSILMDKKPILMDKNGKDIALAPGITCRKSTKTAIDRFDAERDADSARADVVLKNKLDAKYAKADEIFKKIETGKHLSVADVVTLSDGTINILFFKKLLENDFGPDKYVAMLGELESIALSSVHDGDRIRAIDVLTKKIEQIMRLGVEKKDAYAQPVINIIFPVEFNDVKEFYASRDKTCKTVANLSEPDPCPVPDNNCRDSQWENMGTPSDS